MCRHQRYFETSYSTLVCMECGLEVLGFLKLDHGYSENLPLFEGYSRVKRFRSMLMAILNPYAGRLDSHTQVYFADNRFDDIPTMMVWLKRATSKNKQYYSEVIITTYSR